MKTACVYAVVQFRPYVETGEFANVGIVMLNAEQRFFEFQLLRKYSRVTQFFRELDRRVYHEAIAGCREEVERVRGFVRRNALDGRRTLPDVALAQQAFAELIRLREGVIRFDMPRLVMADEPAVKLKALFDHYVGRNFATKEYQERLLENGIARLLYRSELHFGPDKIGTEDFVVRFPFVKKDNQRATSIIKPLFLGQDDSTHILTKGDNWISKVKRLRRQNQLPKQVLFALAGPAPDADRRYRAYQEIENELKSLDVSVLPASNDAEILTFARK